MTVEEFSKRVAETMAAEGENWSSLKEWAEQVTKKVLESTPEAELTEEALENVLASYKRKCKEKQAQLR